MPAFTLSKTERLCGRKTIDALFSDRHRRSIVAFPLRVVYVVRPREDGMPAAQMLVSVSKRRFHHAVDRNRAKRQVREGYRLNKHILTAAAGSASSVAMAFLWMADEPQNTERVMRSVKNLLGHIAERMARKGEPT